MSRVVAILPAFNEEVSIGSVVLLTRLYVDHIVVVDDGSTDRTSEMAQLAGAEVISHPVNKGKGAALKTGFKSVKNADIIITMDTDGQHNPADIPRLTAPIIRGEADMVNGSRYLEGNDKNTPLYRRIGQIMLDGAINLNSGLKITDTQSGFRAFAARIAPIFKFKQNSLAIESEMLTDAAKAGLVIKEVEISVRYDVDCSTEHPLNHGIGILIKVLQDMELNKPLISLAVPGIMISCTGIWMSLSFIRAFYFGEGLYFWRILIMLLLILIGASATLAGVMLHFISKMIDEPKGIF